MNDEYTDFLNRYNIERPRCKCCGNDIIYSNTRANFTKRWGLTISGKSYKTVKIVDDSEFHLCVCEKCLRQRFSNIRNLSRTFNVMSEVTRFAFNIPDDVFLKSRSKYAMTEQHMIEKYGKDEGKTRWKTYCERQAETNSFEYKNKKYGMTKEEFDSFNKNRACTLDNFIRRWGETEGRARWEKYRKRQSETKKTDYILNKYGQNELDRILKCRRTGFEKSTTDIYSKISQEFFKELDEVICKKFTSQYFEKGGEKEIEINNRKYFLDYFIPELNICVEFNGSIFHGDPHIFKDDDRCLPFDNNVTAKDLREKDENRYKILEEKLGIKTYVIWESEYKKGMTGKRFAEEILNLKI